MLDHPPFLMRSAYRPYRGLGMARQLQCVGCDKNYLWYSVGLPLVSLVRAGLRWSSWYSPKLIKTVECGLVCLRRCVALEAPSELDAVNS
jgi:hypothetical protein